MRQDDSLTTLIYATKPLRNAGTGAVIILPINMYLLALQLGPTRVTNRLSKVQFNKISVLKVVKYISKKRH